MNNNSYDEKISKLVKKMYLLVKWTPFFIEK